MKLLHVSIAAFYEGEEEGKIWRRKIRRSNPFSLSLLPRISISVSICSLHSKAEHQAKCILKKSVYLLFRTTSKSPLVIANHTAVTTVISNHAVPGDGKKAHHILGVVCCLASSSNMQQMDQMPSGFQHSVPWLPVFLILKGCSVTKVLWRNKKEEIFIHKENGN